MYVIYWLHCGDGHRLPSTSPLGQESGIQKRDSIMHRDVRTCNVEHPFEANKAQRPPAFAVSLMMLSQGTLPTDKWTPIEPSGPV